MSRILADVRVSVLSWARSPSAVFFTLAFPIILMGVFGSIFGGGNPQVPLAIQDNDQSAASAQLVEAFTQTGAIKVSVIAPGQDAGQVAKDKDYASTLVIPRGYGESLQRGQRAELTLLTDPSRQESRTAEGVVRAVVAAFNARASGAPERVAVQSQQLQLAGGGRFIDFFMPGVIGMTMATTALIGGLEVGAKLKQRGILRKIATTPIRKWEWVLSKVLYQVFIGSLTAVVILVTGVVLFGVRVRIGWEVPAMVVLAAAVFAGMAMAMSRWVKEEDQANAAGSAVTFPMMFLSGTFFPLASMPVALQAVARVLPLTYVNEGLRAAMITGNGPTLALNLGVTAGLAALAMVAGSLLLEWKEV